MSLLFRRNGVSHVHNHRRRHFWFAPLRVRTQPTVSRAVVESHIDRFGQRQVMKLEVHRELSCFKSRFNLIHSVFH